MEQLLDILKDTLLDFVKLLPFLFLAYLLMEILEHKAGERTEALIRRSGRFGPAVGAVLGVIPQCGFAAATSNFYAAGLITRGTLLAVYLSTSDEMLPILISRGAPAALILKILGVKIAVGLLVGFAVDLVARKPLSGDIHSLCEDQDCGCEHDGVFKAALRHTLKIAAFLLAVTLILNLAVGYIGEDKIAGLILNKPVAGELIAGLIGLIPNCAASVVITELYLQGAMSAGAMLSGLLVGSGVGLLVLFRSRRRWKDNLLTLALLYGSGVAAGLLIGALPLF
ncbi:MAG: arsenic efflux protein [Oscillospiraceae bacterium]|nr:arsenic efflux protein [Oscillospiraceae bacterium]